MDTLEPKPVNGYFWVVLNSIFLVFRQKMSKKPFPRALLRSYQMEFALVISLQIGNVGTSFLTKASRNFPSQMPSK